MNGGFIDQVSQDIKYTYKEIVEKDLYVHDLLSNLFSDQYFKENFFFKGGKCLVKCYLVIIDFRRILTLPRKTWILLMVYRLNSRKKNRFH